MATSVDKLYKVTPDLFILAVDKEEARTILLSIIRASRIYLKELPRDRIQEVKNDQDL